VEDTVIRRIDRQKYNKDDPSIKNRLIELKVVDGSAILVEEKDPQEIANESDDVINLHKITSSEERVDIDSTENIRTVIVNLESEKSVFERY
jgi:methylthioribose-1-phosphate isomerase